MKDIPFDVAIQITRDGERSNTKYKVLVVPEGLED